MIQNILLLCRTAWSTPFPLGPANDNDQHVSFGEPARESLAEHFSPRRRNPSGAAPGSLRYLRLDACDH